MLIASICVITFDKAQNRDKTEYCKRERTYNYGMYTYNFGSVSYWPDIPSSTCGYGSYNRAYDDAIGLSTLNHIRSMTGISTPVTINSNWNDAMMSCSVVNAKKNKIDHYPKTSDKCFTWTAWAGCRYSNLGVAWGAPQNSADGVLSFLNDEFVESLGHRLWVIHPGMTQTSFGGVKTSNNYYYGMISINGTKFSGYPEVPFIAWPPPGPVHYQLYYKYWSFQAKGLTSSAKVSVKIGGQTKSPSVQYFEQNYNFLPMIKFVVDDAANLKGKAIEVTVTDGSNTYKYTTTSVDCGAYVKPDGKIRDGSTISGGGSSGSGSSGGSGSGGSGSGGSSGSSGSSGSGGGRSSSVKASQIVPWIVLGVFIVVVIAITVILFKKVNCVVVASHVEERRETKMTIV